MEAIIKKWGNSLGIRIPSLMAKDLSLKDGSHVEIQDEEDRIVIIPKRKEDLKTLLGKINNANIHKEIGTGRPVGNEIW
jgi:antitoxin MazE